MRPEPDPMDPLRPNWPLLAALRFALASVVMGVHIAVMWFFGPISPVWALGQSAVCFFFVISGYSISASIRHKPEGFYVRRLKRLTPVYLLAVLLSFMPWVLHGIMIYCPLKEIIEAPPITPYGVTQMLTAFIGLNAIVTAPYVALGPGWSLTIEILLYTLAPWFLRLEKRGNGIWIVMGISAAIYCVMNPNHAYGIPGTMQYA